MKGVGEVPLVLVMAPAANAVHNTRGKRFYSLPMSPSLIFASTSPGMERILLKLTPFKGTQVTLCVVRATLGYSNARMRRNNAGMRKISTDWMTSGECDSCNFKKARCCRSAALEAGG